MKTFTNLLSLILTLILVGCGPSGADNEASTKQPSQKTDRIGGTDSLAATVLGEDIFTEQAGEMQSIVIGKLFDQYAQENNLEATEEEIKHFTDSIKKGEEAQGSDQPYMSDEETAQLATMRNSMAQSMIRQWKINRALFNQYGGRIIYQQFGPEPLDAYRMFLEDQQEAGSFEIKDASMKQDFWQYFTDDSIHSFYEQGSEAEANAYSVPLWEQLLPGQQ